MGRVGLGFVMRESGLMNVFSWNLIDSQRLEIKIILYSTEAQTSYLQLQP